MSVDATASRRARRDRGAAPDAKRPSILRMPSRETFVDLAFSLPLVTIALVGFRTGFIGWQWVVAAAVGVVLGTLLAHIALARSWPLLLTALVLVAVHFVLGGPVAVRGDLIAGILPSPETLKDLAVTPVTG